MSDVEALLHSPEPEIRRRAVAGIPQLARERRPAVLLRAIADADWRVRKEATEVAISLAPDEEILQALLGVLGPGDDVGQRNAAVEALGGFGSVAVEALAKRVGTLDADGRKLAAEALARAGGRRALGVLQDLLSDGDPNVRTAAIESLADAGTADVDRAATLLLGALGNASTLEALAALEGLNRLGVVVPWGVLKDLVEVPVLERAALVAIGRSRHADAAARLVRALDDSKVSTRHVALAALAAFVEQQGPARDASHMSLASLGDVARRWLIERVRDESERSEERKNALLVLGAVGTTDAADVAIQALGDDHIAEEAEVALTMLGPAAVLALAARARTGSPKERVVCVQLLARLADESTQATARQAIMDAAQDAAEEVVRAALDALSVLGDERSMGLASRWLAPTAPAPVRHAAASALAALAVRHADAARMLAQRARPDGPTAAAAAVVMAAAEAPVFGSPQGDVEFLAVAASHVDPLVRRLAVEALGRLPLPAAAEAVAFALSDEAPEVQLSAARALGQMRDTDGKAVGVRHLLEVVTESQDDGLSVAAIEALGATGDDQALSVLVEVVRHGPPMRAVVAVEAVGRLESPSRLGALLEALEHAELEVVKAALRATAAERDPRIEAKLAKALAHAAWDLRRLAADLLGQRGDESAKTLLRSRLGVETEPLVREALQRSLAEAEGVTGMRVSLRPSSFGGSDE